MKLSYLIKACTPVWVRMIDPASTPRTDPEITSIHSSAQDVKPGGLFIAIKGFKADGHDYIDQALANGAAAIVTGRSLSPENTADAVMVEVKDTRKAMSSIAARFYGNPSKSMVLTGITGTNGKTTTSWILESILQTAGFDVGVIGTVNFRYRNQSFDNPITTPESIDLHKILAQMKKAGVTHVLMEVSSHAIDLHRVRDCPFDRAIFTNLTRDHLDYHKTMEAYFACKKRLFTRLLNRKEPPLGPEKQCAIINMNYAWGRKLADLLPSETTMTTACGKESKNCYNGQAPTSSLFASEMEDTISGLRGKIHIGSEYFSFHSALTGSFNLENILCAAGAAHSLGIPPETIRSGIERCQGVPGRLERVENSGERHIFVDYAHTPDALESILETLKMRAPARIITLFGCGGDRDNTKRPVMGEIAARYSDIIIVTSDNPRSEDPVAIITEIMLGVERGTAHENGSGKEIIVEPDRAKALRVSIEISHPGDIVIAAGKGHETYQVIHSGKIDFDDRLILGQAIKDCGFAKEVQS